MKKHFLYQLLTVFYLAILWSSPYIMAQPVIEWEKNLGGTANDLAISIIQTNDGGYITAGYTRSNNGDVSGNNGNSDFWIVKMDTVGSIEWKRTYGGTYVEEAFTIQQTNDGGYIIGGSTTSNDGDISGYTNGGSDIWIVKINATGTLIWENNFGGSQFEWIESIQQTMDGGYIMACYSRSNNDDVGGNYGDYDYWVVKTDEIGNMEWEQNYGGSEQDRVSHIQQTNDGGYIIAGTTYSNDGDVGGNNSPGGSDAWIVKTDSIGTLQWEKNYGGTMTDGLRFILQEEDGTYFMAGHALSQNGDIANNYGMTDFWAAKINEMGEIIWEKNYGGTNIDVGTSAQKTNDGGYIMTGYSKSVNIDVNGNYGENDYLVVKIDPLGNKEWAGHFGGSAGDTPRSIQQTSEGGYIVAGLSRSNDIDVSGNYGQLDFWVVKLSACLLPETNEASLVSCESSPASGVATFNLSNLDTIVNIGTDNPVNWYSDLDGNVPILNDENYLSSTGIVYAHVGNSPCIEEVEILLTVNAIANISSLNGQTETCQFSQETYIASGTTNTESYEWTLPPGANIIGSTNVDNVTINWEDSSGGLVCVSAINNCGLSDTVCIEVSVHAISTGTDNAAICPGETFIYPGDGQAYPAGTHNITLANSTINGCDSIVTLDVFAYPVSTGADSATVCSGQTFIYPGDGQAYPAGTHNITLANSDINGCDSIVTLNISAYPPTGTVFNETVCFGETFIYNGQVYQPGVHNLIYSDINGCDSIVVLIINELSLLDNSVTSSGNILTANATNANYQWLDCNNDFNPLPNETNQSFTPTESGTYAVAISDDSCSVTSDCNEVIIVSTSKIGESLEVTCSPNPVSDLLNIYTNYQADKTATLTDLTGKKILSKLFYSDHTTLKLQDISPGIYFLTLSMNEYTTTIKVLKQ